MTIVDQQTWIRVRERLRAEVGEDIYLSWFARMELESSEGETVKLSVPTRFLKSWIQSHYAEKVLTCWRAENAGFSRIELIVRSSMLRPATPKNKSTDTAPPVRENRELRPNGIDFRPAISPVATAHDGLGGSPLDPRLTFETFVVGRC